LHRHIELGERHRATGVEMRGQICARPSVDPGENSSVDAGPDIDEMTSRFWHHPAAQQMASGWKRRAGRGGLELGKAEGGLVHPDALSRARPRGSSAGAAA